MNRTYDLPCDPGKPGPYALEPAVVYASTGVPYPTHNNILESYWIYNNPSEGYAVARRIDCTAFIQDVSSPYLPFKADSVPLNGHVFVPRGDGPFPLAVFVHGNHGEVGDNSALGYFYLCELLASHGIVAVTIDLMFASSPTPYVDEIGNIAMGMEYGVRGVLVLEHVKLLAQWNARPEHPLYQKLDMTHIMLVGHSRGGEAVLDAAHINQMTTMRGNPYHPEIPLTDPETFGPYGFNIDVLVGIAATSGQDFRQYGYRVPAPHHYFMIHGTRDRDIGFGQSYETYLISPQRKPMLEGGGLKPLEKGRWELYGANHNYFNTVWQNVDMKGTSRGALLTPEQQQSVAKIYIGSIAQRYLLQQSAFDAVLQDHALAINNGWLEKMQIVSEYHHHERLVIQHQQESTGAPVISSPLIGNVSTHGNIRAKRNVLGLGSGFHYRHILLTLEWFEPGARYILEISTTPLDLSKYLVLSLDVGQARDTLNDASMDGLGFSIVISASHGSARFSTRDFHILPYPDSNLELSAANNQYVLLQTFRLPLTAIAEQLGDISTINKIELIFDQSPTGAIHCGAIQFSQ